jgi:hypothetical protein
MGLIFRISREQVQQKALKHGQRERRIAWEETLLVSNEPS